MSIGEAIGFSAGWVSSSNSRTADEVKQLREMMEAMMTPEQQARLYANRRAEINARIEANRRYSESCRLKEYHWVWLFPILGGFCALILLLGALA